MSFAVWKFLEELAGELGRAFAQRVALKLGRALERIILWLFEDEEEATVDEVDEEVASDDE